MTAIFGVVMLAAVIGVVFGVSRERVLGESTGARAHARWVAKNPTGTKRVEGVLVSVECHGARVTASAPYRSGAGPSFAIVPAAFRQASTFPDVEAHIRSMASHQPVGGDVDGLPLVAAVMRRHARASTPDLELIARDGVVSVSMVPSGLPESSDIDWLVQITASIATYARALLGELAKSLEAQVEILPGGRAHVVVLRRVPIEITLARLPDRSLGLQLEGEARGPLDSEIVARIDAHLREKLGALVVIAAPRVQVSLPGLPSADRVRDVLDAFEQLLAPETDAPFR